ncbi:hypothetical protein RIF29_01895 [Crotalaria pallida]|uniref:RHOMBOID-like protein n=1 Tax=Crotalaria pallida TaxID=3830 RepID=A0AAN9IYH7_CROPI
MVGEVKIGIIYLLSGFGGSVLSSLFIRNSISIGTSSALVGLLGAMLSELITNWTLYSDKENIRRCVRIIYDPSRSDQGVLALKALKLSDSFMELYRSKNFTIDKLRRTYHGWISMRKYLSNSTIVACLISRPSSKHGFRREL